MADLLSAGFDSKQRLNKPLNAQLPIHQQYLSLRLPHRKVSVRLLKSKYIELFDQRAFNAVNQYITNEASSQSRESFRTIFGKVADHTSKNCQYKPRLTFDRFFHLANIYGNGLFSSDGINRVASWLSVASADEIKKFKGIMGELKSSQNASRPISEAHSTYNPLPNSIRDTTLAQTARDVVVDRVTAKRMSIDRAEAEKRRQEESRLLAEREKFVASTFQNHTLHQQRPSSAPAVSVSSHKNNFQGKKPYGSFDTTSRAMSTNRDHFSEPSTKLAQNRPATADGKRPKTYKNDRMSFTPKAIMPTATFGVVVPASDTAYLEHEDTYPLTQERKQRYYTEIPDSERLAKPPRVSKKLSEGLTRTTYSSHYDVRSSHMSNTRVKAPPSSLKAPYGYFPTAKNHEKVSEYGGQYSRRSLASTYSPTW